jgi:hypothetical protein
VNADRLSAIYRAKVRAELGAADAEVPGSAALRWRGNLLADVMIVAGEPSLSDRAEGAAVTGALGEAAAKALAALSIPSESVFALVSRPTGEAAPGALARRLELAIEAVDPRLVIALDADAASDLARAYGLDALPSGVATGARGRTIGYVGDLGASLADAKTKAAVWRAFKVVAKAL